MSDDTRPDSSDDDPDLGPRSGESSHELMTANRVTAASVPTPAAGYMLAAGEGVDGRGAEVKCSNGSTGGSLAMYRTVVDGDGPPVHAHTLEDETIVVLDGSIECECGQDTWSGGPGTVFFMPRGLPHTFRSLDGPATILFLITPGHLDDFFRLREHAVDSVQVIDLVRRFL